MDSAFVFRSRLRSEMATYVSAHETPFEVPDDEPRADGDSASVLVPSSRRDAVVLEAVPSDVDPHSDDVVGRGQQRAIENGTRVFATVNENDAFLFRRPNSESASPTTDVSEFTRRGYDLRTRSMAEFCGELLRDAVALQEGTESPVRFGDFFVGRLRSFHATLVPRYESLIADAFEEDDGFHDSMATWADENGYPLDSDFDRAVRIAAQQYGCLLVARIAFDGYLRDGDREPSEAREGFATEAWKDSNDGFWSEIPNDGGTLERLREFAESVEREPLDDIETDVLGRVYQKLIPAEERAELGQFYTPDEIGRLLARWAVRSPSDRVLDPASGSGSLLVEAYKRLDALGSGNRSHRNLLRQLTAVDIDEFPLRLTELNLAARNRHEPADERLVHHRDFFDLDPEAVGTFDATVANPPYVRQESIATDREHFREHLEALDSGAALDGRSDLYCYFLTHVTGFLREGARVAWIVPTKWMTADYGPSLQRFLYDHYKVEAVVGFRNRLFEDALVDTVLLLLERTDDATTRRNTRTNFVRLNERMGPDDVIDVIDRDATGSGNLRISSERSHRTITVAQSHLAARLGGKLHHYVTAPALYTAVLEHAETVSLSEIATVTRGKKTGANPVFILDTDDDWVRRVEDGFLRPAIKSVKEVDGYEHSVDDAEKWMLDVADYSETVLSSSESVDGDDCDDVAAVSSETRVIAALERDGHDGVAAYLRWADDHPSSTNDSVRINDPWFAMGGLDGKTAPIVCPQAMDTRRFFFRTDGEVVASNRFLLVHPRQGDVTLLLGLLNASLSKVVIESHGRVTGGGAINLSSSDLRTLRVVDPEALTDEQKATVREGFERLAAGDDGGQTAIDDVIIDVLDLDVSAERIRTIARTMKSARRTKGEVESAVRTLDALEDDIEIEFDD
ncbi:N-6 DNA methylase [Haladaptatus sp. R4]|uniref:HsdM family class I SAM-dependent methyltransferase n=1 Tax=Haladaptatus sp. R4 TaxID=1679489 RepID=UPI0007B4E9DB|nr:N-6 DNA methylase [Haladaptatus sp. R4]KZN25738.1 N-6 DNA methylase [Haladaptatus sp. R4]